MNLKPMRSDVGDSFHSALKKRSGPHEKTIRELRMHASGITLGEPLTQFHGVLTGVPSFVGVMPSRTSGQG